MQLGKTIRVYTTEEVDEGKRVAVPAPAKEPEKVPA